MNDKQIVQRIAMKAAIVHDGKILVLREASTYQDGTNIGRYGLPGGRINPGEPFKDGLEREVMEETGLAIEIGQPFHVSEWFPVIRDVPNQIVGMFIECCPKGLEVALSEEHDDYKWATLEEARRLNLISTEAEAVEAYFSKQG